MRAKRGARLSAFALSILIPGLGVATGGAEAASLRVASGPADLYAGYSFAQAGEANLNGIALAGAHPWGRDAGIVAEFTGHQGTFAQADFTQLGLMIGLRRTVRSGRFRPFVEGLVGAARTTSSVDTGGSSITDHTTSWGFALGGGSDYSLSPRWAARAIVRLRLLRAGGVWDKDPHFTIGAAYRFPRRR